MNLIRIKLLFLLFLFCQKGNSQQTDFIQVTNDSVSSLTFQQYLKYSTTSNQKLYGNGYIVTIGDLPTLQENGILEFQIPDNGCLIKAKSNRVRYFDDNNYSWSAIIITDSIEGNNCRDGSITIIKKEGKYIGNILIGEDSYAIEDLGEGKQFLVKHDYEDIELICGNELDTVQIPENFNSDNAKFRNGNGCPVSILVVYTQNAENSVADIHLTIDYAVEQTNNAFQKSNVDFELELAGVEAVNFTETSGIGGDLNLLIGNQEIQNLKELYFADIVVLLTDGNYGKNHGKARIGPNIDQPYAIVEAPEISSGRTFPHEVGHLFGCRHEKYHDNNGPYEHANRFNLSWFQQRRTIMWHAANRATILHYSNPNVAYSGEITGVHDKKDNARKLNETNCEVALFETDPSINLPLTGYLSGPYAVCVDEAVPVVAHISPPPNSLYNFDWSYSYDGFNYTNLNINSFSVYIPGMDVPPTSQISYPIYIKLVVTDLIDGDFITLFKSVEATNEDIGQESPCSHSPLIKPNQNLDKLVTNNLIFPNPVSTELQFEIKDIDEFQSITIYNLKGNKLITRERNGLGKVNVSNLLPGVYFVQIINDHGKSVSKFVKQ